MSTSNYPSPDLADVKQAQTMVRWMATGIIPSQENANRVRDVLTEFARSDLNEDKLSIKTALSVAGAMSMGVAPSQQACEGAAAEINVIIQRIENRQAMSERSYERPRG